jgi:hypothetical protein
MVRELLAKKRPGGGRENLGKIREIGYPEIIENLRGVIIDKTVKEAVSVYGA